MERKMKKVIIACAGGMSSSLLVMNMVKVSQNAGMKAAMDVVRGMPTFDRFDEDLDIAFIVTGTYAFSKIAFEKYTDTIDFIMIAPQVRYLINDIKKMLLDLDLDIPVAQIQPIDYGRQNGQAVLDVILEAIG